jgi:hypothetical protein
MRIAKADLNQIRDTLKTINKTITYNFKSTEMFWNICLPRFFLINKMMARYGEFHKILAIRFYEQAHKRCN